MTFREEQELKRDLIKVKAFNVMGVKDLDTLEHNVLHIYQETKKGLFVSWFNDDNFESKPEDEAAKHVTALNGRYESDEDSSDEEVSYEELVPSHRKLCIKSKEVS